MLPIFETVSPPTSAHKEATVPSDASVPVQNTRYMYMDIQDVRKKLQDKGITNYIHKRLIIVLNEPTESSVRNVRCFVSQNEVTLSATEYSLNWKYLPDMCDDPVALGGQCGNLADLDMMDEDDYASDPRRPLTKETRQPITKEATDNATGISQAGRPEQTTAGRPEQTTAKRPEQTIAGRPEQTIAGRPEQTIAGRPEQTIAGRPEQTIAGRPEQTTKDSSQQGRAGVGTERNRPWIVSSSSEVIIEMKYDIKVHLTYNGGIGVYNSRHQCFSAVNSTGTSAAFTNHRLRYGYSQEGDQVEVVSASHSRSIRSTPEAMMCCNRDKCYELPSSKQCKSLTLCKGQRSFRPLNLEKLNPQLLLSSTESDSVLLAEFKSEVRNKICSIHGQLKVNIRGITVQQRSCGKVRVQCGERFLEASPRTGRMVIGTQGGRMVCNNFLIVYQGNKYIKVNETYLLVSNRIVEGGFRNTDEPFFRLTSTHHRKLAMKSHRREIILEFAKEVLSIILITFHLSLPLFQWKFKKGHQRQQVKQIRLVSD
ncbi:hypothetical protein CAPTEDRAFT_199266 [Capitella teleta]|uniref:Uncharacterized protein n=1 Tax=Capitella teleta TaxID=283909 RepID=R7UJ38_CAPTE|nr:hypothetical protein CAPTEDRAFT_199266 [Capitella teleta]|eukprot:ELU03818.1 hypothetical protein CAPTEDRAFT_199266 [Capitella teleta]